MTEATTSPPDWHTDDIDSLWNWNGNTWTDSISGMFEGALTSGHLSDNRLYLHMPTSSGQWIDGDVYNQFSLTGKTTGMDADVVLGWADSHGGRDSIEVGELTSTYGRMAAFDLSTEWSGITVQLVWLGFRYTSSVTPRIRIGRVWLEEVEP